MQGLRSLYKAIENLGEDYSFDIYMTDDGCTDGTDEAVRKEFPDIIIIKGGGNLYWSGGMQKAWQAAIDSGIEYDYFLWFNDDVELYEDALLTIFDDIGNDGKILVTGAFCNHRGEVSYGGKTDDDKLLIPNGKNQYVRRMNGNLVLIPITLYKKIGTISRLYKHGYGDYDYGYRAQKKGFRVLLSTKYVGIAERHDEILSKYLQKKYPLRKRWEMLHNPKNNPFITFIFQWKYCGVYHSIKNLLWVYKATLFTKT